MPGESFNSSPDQRAHAFGVKPLNGKPTADQEGAHRLTKATTLSHDASTVSMISTELGGHLSGAMSTFDSDYPGGENHSVYTSNNGGGGDVYVSPEDGNHPSTSSSNAFGARGNSTQVGQNPRHSTGLTTSIGKSFKNSLSFSPIKLKNNLLGQSVSPGKVPPVPGGNSTGNRFSSIAANPFASSSGSSLHTAPSFNSPNSSQQSISESASGRKWSSTLLGGGSSQRVNQKTTSVENNIHQTSSINPSHSGKSTPSSGFRIPGLSASTKQSNTSSSTSMTDLHRPDCLPATPKMVGGSGQSGQESFTTRQPTTHHRGEVQHVPGLPEVEPLSETSRTDEIDYYSDGYRSDQGYYSEGYHSMSDAGGYQSTSDAGGGDSTNIDIVNTSTSTESSAGVVPKIDGNSNVPISSGSQNGAHTHPALAKEQIFTPCEYLPEHVEISPSLTPLISPSGPSVEAAQRDDHDVFTRQESDSYKSVQGESGGDNFHRKNSAGSAYGTPMANNIESADVSNTADDCATNDDGSPQKLRYIDE